MAAGVPVVAAERGAIPEVVGDAALLVDPDDVDALADALHTAVHDDERRRTPRRARRRAPRPLLLDADGRRARRRSTTGSRA